ncbi:regulator of Vps4 activity in the MVB pathway-domain-containing protein [Sphaerosporella brunnea]|uniref:Regulator of Vps4 activity in the MVB pathway-domain-containing protein n=1 Tax=Sphaerosporella brunnea TaxID=1250544 RepID=A0A5J5FAB2_9PEZI|nr:regulator of Vps4 activity in the MVB pathway-domain-containing protein [Sphaerosporella brunnea]
MAPTSTLVSKLKVALKLSISRLRMAQQKESALSKVARREMAQLLEVGKEESARIRVENIIRQDISVELMEILELYCELLLARIGLMEAKECDPGLEEPIKSLIYAAPRTEIRELQTVRQLLVEKYGKEFALSAIENSDGKVSERVLKKLRVEPPEQLLVTLYLKEIARTYGIAYKVTPPGTPPPGFDDDEQPGSGGIGEKLPEEPIAIANPKAAELAKATPPKTLRSPINVAPPSPSSENVHPTIRLPDAPKRANLSVKPAAKPQAAPRSLSSDDDLARRFAALKRP